MEEYCTCKHIKSFHWLSETDGKQCCSQCISEFISKEPNPIKTPDLWKTYGHWMHPFTLDNLRWIEDEAKRRNLI
jgi:hypothetical protein